MSGRSVATPAKQACVVTIGYQTLVLPANKGMALVELLQHAVTAEPKFMSLRDTYTVGEQPRVELSLVKPEQLIFPDGSKVPPVPAKPLRLKGPR